MRRSAIVDAAHGSLSTETRWMLFGGIALNLVAICLVTSLLARSLNAFAWPAFPRPRGLSHSVRFPRRKYPPLRAAANTSHAVVLGRPDMA